MIPKPGKNSLEFRNYRPISLLSVPGKVPEKLILNRMDQTIADLNLIPDFQASFSRGLSTTHQVARLTEEVRGGFRSRQSMVACFLDFQSAFDKV